MTYQSPRWYYTTADILRLIPEGSSVTTADIEAAQKYEDDVGGYCAYLDRVVAVAELLAAERLRITQIIKEVDDTWLGPGIVQEILRQLK